MNLAMRFGALTSLLLALTVAGPATAAPYVVPNSWLTDSGGEQYFFQGDPPVDGSLFPGENDGSPPTPSAFEVWGIGTYLDDLNPNDPTSGGLHVRILTSFDPHGLSGGGDSYSGSRKLNVDTGDINSSINPGTEWSPGDVYVNVGGFYQPELHDPTHSGEIDGLTVDLKGETANPGNVDTYAVTLSKRRSSQGNPTRDPTYNYVSWDSVEQAHLYSAPKFATGTYESYEQAISPLLSNPGDNENFPFPDDRDGRDGLTWYQDGNGVWQLKSTSWEKAINSYPTLAYDVGPELGGINYDPHRVGTFQISSAEFYNGGTQTGTDWLPVWAYDVDILDATRLDLVEQVSGKYQYKTTSVEVWWAMECGNDAAIVIIPVSPSGNGQVPEPGTLAAVSLGLLALRRRRRQQRA